VLYDEVLIGRYRDATENDHGMRRKKHCIYSCSMIKDIAHILSSMDL
jgi:hypothetical protein